MRYFLQLAYNGARFHGWQRQPNARSIQGELEERLSLILRSPIQLTGCGRTDTGVHADDYYAHFDFDGIFPPAFLARLNKFIDRDIFVRQLYQVSPSTHARFDADQRSYRYEIGFQRDVFRHDTLTIYPFADRIDPADLQRVADLIAGYEAFTPFCKTNSDAKTMNCRIDRAEWVNEPDRWIFHVSADRFLRGMIRLIVGCCLRVAEGKIDLEDVRRALDRQEPLSGIWSAPAEGLFLTNIVYPGKKDWKTVKPEMP